MSKLRHFRQRWDPRAELVFIRPVSIGGRRVVRGEVVTPELRQTLGRRLRLWWNNGIVALKDGPGSPPAIEPPQAEALTPPPTLTEEDLEAVLADPEIVAVLDDLRPLDAPAPLPEGAEPQEG